MKHLSEEDFLILALKYPIRYDTHPRHFLSESGEVLFTTEKHPFRLKPSPFLPVQLGQLVDFDICIFSNQLTKTFDGSHIITFSFNDFIENEDNHAFRYDGRTYLLYDNTVYAIEPENGVAQDILYRLC